MVICNNMDKCFGCSLCADECPVDAISMSDETGFYRPTIDETKCISCGKCHKKCISNRVIALYPIDKEVPCYAVYSKDDNLHYEAASGGLCTELSTEFIERGGIVAGSWWNPEKQRVEHRICTSIEEIEYLKKSKYVQSCTEGVFKFIRDITKDKKVLFIGVPCQVYALKQFCSGIDDNLYCIDLLCRGGASSRCLREHLKHLYNGHISNIAFRGGEDDCTLTVFNEVGKKIYRGPQFTDPYFNYFMEHVLYQEKCYECPFAGKKRIGDLTVGDFWGLASDAMPTSGGQGINMVFQNTSKGAELLQFANNNLHIVKRNATEAIAGNETLYCPTGMPPEYDILWKLIHRDGFKEALDLYSRNNYSKRIRISKVSWRKYKLHRLVKRVLPNSAKEALKDIKNRLRE